MSRLVDVFLRRCRAAFLNSVPQDLLPQSETANQQRQQFQTLNTHVLLYKIFRTKLFSDVLIEIRNYLPNVQAHLQVQCHLNQLTQCCWNPYHVILRPKSNEEH